MHLQTNFHHLLLSMFWLYSKGILFQYSSESLRGKYFLLKVECYLLLAHLTWFSLKHWNTQFFRRSLHWVVLLAFKRWSENSDKIINAKRNMNSGHRFKHMFKPIKVKFNLTAHFYMWLDLDTWWIAILLITSLILTEIWLFFCWFRTSRAVRLILSRGDDMLITGGRHPFLGKYKVSVTRIQWKKYTPIFCE